jgi:hypothetical protein
MVKTEAFSVETASAVDHEVWNVLIGVTDYLKSVTSVFMPLIAFCKLGFCKHLALTTLMIICTCAYVFIKKSELEFYQISHFDK